MAKQKPYYYSAFPDKDPTTVKPASDSTKKVVVSAALTTTQKCNSKI
jgi:hypothetical protein